MYMQGTTLTFKNGKGTASVTGYGGGYFMVSVLHRQMLEAVLK